MRISVVVLLGLLVLVDGVDVVQSRTYFSDVFRMKGSGNKARFEVFVKHRPTGEPESVGVTFPDPDELDLASAGNWPLYDLFSANVSSPAQADLFARTVRFEYLPRGSPGGGIRTPVTSSLPANESAYATAAHAAPWARPAFGVMFGLEDAAALRRIVCDGWPPCAGDLTPFLVRPPPALVPGAWYPNLLTMAPLTGTLWTPNRVSSQNIFAEQPAHALGAYDGHVIGYQTYLATTYVDALRQPGCAAVEEGWTMAREVERAGWYPNTLRTAYDAATRRYTVSMGQLQWRQAWKDKLDALTKMQSEFDRLKGLMEKLLSAPPPNDIVINNEFAGMVR